MSAYETITYEQTARIARITLNRAPANTMNDVMARELAHAANRCDRRTTRVVVVTGAGPLFCASGDLVAMAATSTWGRYARAVADDLHRALFTFANMEAVIITAVNGNATGAGFSLAMAGDVVLAARSASLTVPYAAAGLSPDGSSRFYLSGRIDVLATRQAEHAPMVTAEQALQWGLVNEVLDDADLGLRVDALAGKLSCGAQRSASENIKSLFNEAIERV